MRPASFSPDMPNPVGFPVDYVDLAERLQALSYPARLALLDMLRLPRTAAEIRLNPHRVVAGENPERAVSKQAVQGHLDKLVEAGLVRVTLSEVGGRAVNEYIVNAQRLYALTEEMREVCVRYAGRGSVGDDTGTLGPAPSTRRPSGPRLVLVHGLYEGKAFPLVEASQVEGRWTLGRIRGASVALDYDPYVSSAHAYIVREGESYVLHDEPESKNGTLLNWAPIPKGGHAILAPADVIGVGRSLLSFAPG